jgi:Tfp pilus assembly protein PilV
MMPEWLPYLIAVLFLSCGALALTALFYSRAQQDAWKNQVSINKSHSEMLQLLREEQRELDQRIGTIKTYGGSF